MSAEDTKAEYLKVNIQGRRMAPVSIIYYWIIITDALFIFIKVSNVSYFFMLIMIYMQIINPQSN